MRQSGETGAVSTGSFGDGDSLELTQTISGESYTTYIYTDGGKLREIFARTDAELDPATGQAIIDVSSFTVVEDGGLFTVTVGDGAGEASVKLFPRCG